MTDPKPQRSKNIISDLTKNLDNIISYLALIFCIGYGFFGPHKNTGDYVKNTGCFINWENVSVTATIVYTIILYSVGLFGTAFDDLKKKQKGIITTLLFLIIIITIPFSFDFLGEFLGSQVLTKIANVISWNRIDKMWFLTITAGAFLIIDLIMERSNGSTKIKFHNNKKYSEIPVFITFCILLGYSYFIGAPNIVKYGLEPYFAGTVAFQMITSNIIWIQNDDKFWEELLTKK